ncbi:hypothetical protein BKA93DRAFT_754619 [Sparassis latifolia]
MNSDHFTSRINGTILCLYAHLYPEGRKIKLTCMINAVSQNIAIVTAPDTTRMILNLEKDDNKEKVIAGQYFKFIAEVGNTRINLNALYHSRLPKEVVNEVVELVHNPLMILTYLAYQSCNDLELYVMSAPPDRIYQLFQMNIEKVLTIKEAETEAKKTKRISLLLLSAIIKYEKSFCKCYLSNGPNKNHLTFLNIYELDLWHCLDYNVLQIQILAKAAIPLITSLTSLKYTISYQHGHKEKKCHGINSNFLQLLARLPCLHTFHLDTPMLAFTPPVELTRIDTGQQYFNVMLQHEETTVTMWFRELPTLCELYFCHGELNEYEMFWYWEINDSDKQHIHGRRLETDGELMIKEGIPLIENGQRNTSTSTWTVDRRSRRPMC